MSLLLAIDAGGTSTRAAAVTGEGRCVALARAGSGNPTAAGIETAVDSFARATRDALSAAASRLGTSPDAVKHAPTARVDGVRARIVAAGVHRPRFLEALTTRLAALGVDALDVSGDLAGVFHSGTADRSGTALIAGTGAISSRVADGELAGVVDGTGWLLGDAGSGFWIGHRVARAVTAALDGSAPATALTEDVLAWAGVAGGAGATDRVAGRDARQAALVEALYELTPVELASLAPLAFAHADDPVAGEILVDASRALARLVAAARRGDEEGGGTVVAGGSVVRALADPPAAVAGRLAPLAPGARVVLVPDGVVGAAVLALRATGRPVDDVAFRRLTADVDALR